MKNHLDIPPFWTLGAIITSWLLSGLAPIALVDIAFIRLIAPMIMLCAMLLIVWSGFWVRRKMTGIEPRKQPTSLIVEGPYRLSRNPIYLAMVVMSFGFALWLSALSAILPVIGLVFVLRNRFVLPEEAVLIDTFGDEAHAYIRQTRRWV
ncbi:isoprenylcysteine carboxyl methyltransferase family protein [Rhodobacterales bacterium HTCC2150]|nr:isoprenylcysteine carboxyl methyltransferase family protein [Rhodobacterales bacterium HTCC2150] [Rhodobacteraceae bacterium HTCC2150]